MVIERHRVDKVIEESERLRAAMEAATANLREFTAALSEASRGLREEMEGVADSDDGRTTEES